MLFFLQLVKVGIIGAGIIGNRLAQSFDNHPDVEIKYVNDLSNDAAEELAEKYKAKATIDQNVLFDDPEIDFVYVGVPPKFHAEIAVKALNAGKHVICEKPIALNQDEVKQMIEARDDNKAITAINFPFRFEPGIKRLKEELDKNSIGEVLKLALRFRFPTWPRAWQQTEWLSFSEQGGPLREVGSHYFFALLELFGEVDEIKAYTDYPDDNLCETKSSAIIRMKNGLICDLSLIVGNDEPEENTLIVYGSKGTYYHRMWHALSLKRLENEELIMAERSSSEYEMVENFVKAVKGDENAKANLVSFEDAGKAQFMLEAILEK